MWRVSACHGKDQTTAHMLAPCLALACALGLASGVPATAAQDQAPAPVVVDSDMISDDWMATLFLLNDPQFDIKAITVAGTGFADCEAGVASASGILALALPSC